jgi:thioredoxin 1
MKILKFSSTWCQPCKLLSENLREINLDVEEIDVDDHPDLAKQFKIKALPTLVFLKDGVELSRLTGSQRLDVLRAMLERVELVSSDIAHEAHLHVAMSPEHQLQLASS